MEIAVEENELSLIDETLFGMTIDSREVQPEKAPTPMYAVPSGRTTYVNDEQYKKA